MIRAGRIQIIKYAPPPPELPMLGKARPEDCSFIGRTNYVTGIEEKKFVFGLKRHDRRHHVYLIGKSGIGKTKMLELLVRQDIAHGYGVAVVDAQGDLVDSLIDFIPEERVADVCVFDPSDTEHPLAWNPLSGVPAEFKHSLTQSFIEVMEKEFGTHWNPRIEHLFRFVCLALLDYPHATMRGMILLLTDAAYREEVKKHVKDDIVRKFFTNEFEGWVRQYESDAIVPLVNKLAQFVLHPLLRTVFEREEHKVDVGAIMERGGIFLANLARGKLGDQNANFLGALLIAKMKQAGMARANLSESAKKDFYLYLDEFHGCATETFENLLSEARKFGMCLTLCHQYLEQLAPRLQAAILGNVGTIIVFRASGEDAARLEVEMNPVFKAKDMINLGTQEFYIKMTIDGETNDPFSAETLKVLPSPRGSFRSHVIAASRARYAAKVSSS